MTLYWQMERKKAVPIKNKLGAFQPQTNSETEKKVNKQTALKISISLSQLRSYQTQSRRTDTIRLDATSGGKKMMRSGYIVPRLKYDPIAMGQWCSTGYTRRH